MNARVITVSNACFQCHTPFATMNRTVSGTLGSSLMINVPGNPQAAVQSLEAVLHLIPHALALLSSNTEHTEPDYAPKV